MLPDEHSQRLPRCVYAGHYALITRDLAKQDQSFIVSEETPNRTRLL